MQQLKIIADDKIPFLKGVLEPYADIRYLPGAKITADDVRDADAIFTRTRTKCDAALLAGSKVRLIATATIGFDHIDTAYCEANGIRWVNAPGCNSASVRQYIMTAILSFVEDFGWEIKGKTIGVIGVGNVGSKIAVAAKAIGMNVILNDPPRADKEGGEKFVSLDTLLQKSDIITCHTPLTKGGAYPTLHLADDAFFAKMRRNALYINTSRGPVLDSNALKRTIADGKLSAFILDVWENEPDIDPLLLDQAYIATPHIAGYSADGKANGTAACIRELVSFFKTDYLSAEWFPERLPQPQMQQEISIDATAKTLRQIACEIMTHTYPIKEDSRILKAAPAQFEKLRGDYRIRREPAYYTVNITGDPADGKQADIAQMLKGSGFNTVLINKN